MRKHIQAGVAAMLLGMSSLGGDARSPVSEEPLCKIEPNGKPEDKSAKKPRYVAMGDSYSSGEGAGDYLPAAQGLPANCHRSRAAYAFKLQPHMVGRYSFDSTKDFLACSGHTIGDLMKHQVPRLNADVGLITIGIGGNDSGWTDALKACMVDAVAHPKPGSGEGCNKILEKSFQKNLGKLEQDLSSAYAAIRKRAPKATVIVVGYPAIFEDSYASTFCASVGALTRGARSDVREATGKLNDVIRRVAKEHGFRFVDPRPAYDDHRICGPKGDWLHGVTINRETRKVDLSPSTFHPNAAGQAGFAGAISKANSDVLP